MSSPSPRRPRGGTPYDHVPLSVREAASLPGVRRRFQPEGQARRLRHEDCKAPSITNYERRRGGVYDVAPSPQLRVAPRPPSQLLEHVARDGGGVLQREPASESRADEEVVHHLKASGAVKGVSPVGIEGRLRSHRDALHFPPTSSGAAAVVTCSGSGCYARSWSATFRAGGWPRGKPVGRTGIARRTTATPDRGQQTLLDCRVSLLCKDVRRR